MAEKHFVCDGAVCKCNYGTATDKLKVLTHNKEYINDADGSQKLAASTKDINASFEKNSFGSCSLQRNNPCNAIITQWQGFYEKHTLSNGGKMLLENSKATCPVGGAGCIQITFHGQKGSVTQQQKEQADDAVLAQLYPLGSLKQTPALLIPQKQ